MKTKLNSGVEGPGAQGKGNCTKFIKMQLWKLLCAGCQHLIKSSRRAAVDKDHSEGLQQRSCAGARAHLYTGSPPTAPVSRERERENL